MRCSRETANFCTKGYATPTFWHFAAARQEIILRRLAGQSYHVAHGPDPFAITDLRTSDLLSGYPSLGPFLAFHSRLISTMALW